MMPKHYCLKLKERLEQSREVMSRLNDGAHEVREFVNQQRYADHVRFGHTVDELYLQCIRGSGGLREEGSGSFRADFGVQLHEAE